MSTEIQGKARAAVAAFSSTFAFAILCLFPNWAIASDVTQIPGIEVKGTREYVAGPSLGATLRFRRGSTSRHFAKVEVPAFRNRKPERDEEGDPSCDAENPKSSMPVIIQTRAKTEREIDYSGTGETGLEVSRTYLSSDQVGAKGSFGPKWYSPIDRKLSFKYKRNSDNSEFTCEVRLSAALPAACVDLINGTVQQIYLFTGAGAKHLFDDTDPASPGKYLDKKASPTSWVEKLPNGSWKLAESDGSFEIFSEYGFPLSRVNTNGVGWTFQYSGVNRLDSITHTGGRSIQFQWLDLGGFFGSRIQKFIDPAGSEITYNYSSAGDLTSVVPRGPNASSRTRSYTYDTGTLLTGIAVGGIGLKTVSYSVGGAVSQSGLADGSEQTLFSNISILNGSPYPTHRVITTNSLGVVTHFDFETDLVSLKKRLVKKTRSGVTNCPTEISEQTYDSNGYPDTEVDFSGNVTRYSYNAKGQLQSLITGENALYPAEKRLTMYQWDPLIPSRLDKVLEYGASTMSPVSEIDYDYWSSGAAINRLKSVTYYNRTANGVPNQAQVTQYGYSFHGNGMVATMTEDGPVSGPSDSVTYAFSSAGDLLSVVNVFGHQVLYSNYNSLGLPGTVTDANGFAVHFTYDAEGKVLSTSRTLDGLPANTTYTHSRLGGLAQVNFPGGGFVANEYSAVGRLWQVDNDLSRDVQGTGPTNPISSAWQTYEYDLLGNPTSLTVTKETTRTVLGVEETTTENPFKRGWGYDSLGRLTSDRNAANQAVTSYTYDANGNVKTRTESGSRTWTYTYNTHNQLKTITDPLNQVTQYGYDDAGNVNLVIDPKGNPTDYIYDGLGNLVSQSSPDSGVTTYSYDEGGRLQSMVRADGSITSYGYDGLSRLSSVVSGAASITYGYDSCTYGLGRLCTITDASGTSSYTYRQNGQLASQTAVISGSSYSTSWAYDQRERVTGITYPGGMVVNYAYDTQSNVTGITATIGGVTSTVASHVTYAGMGFGPRAQMRMGDGSGRQSSWTYDANYRLTNTKATNLHNLTFGYDLGNRLTGITDGITAANSQTLGYDSLDRLTSVTSTGVGNQGWTFDLNSNRESHTWGGLTDDYLPDLYSNRIGSLTGSRAKTYTHDLRGNTATESGWRGSYTYGYDAFNRQTSVTKNGVTTTYSYNALNQRTRKAGPGGNFNYVHAPDGSLLGETSAGGTSLTTQYIWLAGKPIALNRSGVLYFIRHDQLGRPDVVSNTAGSIVWKAKNAAYDRTITTDTIGGLNLGFPGQYYDSESGNWYNWNRYYDSTGGRYTQSDPIGLAGGPNTYIYVEGNPISRADPAGLGPGMAAVACEAANAAYSVYSFRQTMNELSSGTSLIRDQLSRVDHEISECPTSDVKRLGQLWEIRASLAKQLSDATKAGSPGPLAAIEDVGWGMVGAGICGLLLLAPTP